MNAQSLFDSRSSPPLWRPVFASVIATATAAEVTLVLSGISAQFAFVVGIFVSAIALAHTLLLGIPWAYWMHRIDRFRAWSMALGGFLVGSVPLGLFVFPEYKTISMLGGFGAVGGLAFYLASRFITRDRDVSLSPPSSAET